MSTAPMDRTPSPLALRIAQDLLNGYVAHGLCTAEMIHDAALQLALRLNGAKEGWKAQ